MKNWNVKQAGHANSEIRLRIKFLSTVARWCAWIGLTIIALTAVYLAYVVYYNPAGLADAGLAEMLNQQFLPEGFFAGLPLVVKLIIYVAMLGQILPALLGFYSANILFSKFNDGVVFTRDAAKRIRLIGWVIVVIPLWTIIVDLAIAGVLTVFKTVGKVSMTVSFEVTDMMAIVFGLLFVILGRIIGEAVKISDENRQFV